MNKWIIGLGLGFLLAVVSPALAVEGELTISDREIIERLTRLEERFTRLEEGQKALRDELRNEINGVRNELKGDIQDLRGLMYVVLGGMIALIGFVIWDRRSALSPVITRARELEEDRDRTLRVLKEYARNEPKLAEIMKSSGLMQD
jgi:hypothetical protein